MKKRCFLMGAAAVGTVGAVALLPIIYNVERRNGYVTKFWEEDEDFVYRIPSLETGKQYELDCMHVREDEAGFFKFKAFHNGTICVDVKKCTNSTGAVEDPFDFCYNTVRLSVRNEDMCAVPIHLNHPTMTSIPENGIELYTKRGKRLAARTKTHAPFLFRTKGVFTFDVEEGCTYILKVSPSLKSTDDYVDSSVRLSMRYM